MASTVGRTRKVDPSVMADAVHERIRDAILSAELRPNHRLVEEELAAELDVSRTPVREALLRLRQEGLVVQHRGWVVRDHAPSEILEIIEARASVESAAAYLAAKRIDEATLAELEDLATEMEAPGLSRIKINELNNRFHELVTNASGNSQLIQFARRTRINYWNFNQPVTFTPDDDHIVNTQHRELLEALRTGDGDTALRITRAHIEMTATIIATALGLD